MTKSVFFIRGTPRSQRISSVVLAIAWTALAEPANAEIFLNEYTKMTSVADGAICLSGMHRVNSRDPDDTEGDLACLVQIVASTRLTGSQEMSTVFQREWFTFPHKKLKEVCLDFRSPLPIGEEIVEVTEMRARCLPETKAAAYRINQTRGRLGTSEQTRALIDPVFSDVLSLIKIFPE